MIFDLEGKFLGELKKPMEAILLDLLPAGYLCRSSYFDRDTARRQISFCIYSRNFESRKILLEYVDESMKFDLTNRSVIWKHPISPVMAVVYRDKIFIGDPRNGIHFEVFDPKGNKLYHFNAKYEKVKITKKFQKQYVERFIPTENEQIKTTNVFSAYLPGFQYFRIKDDRIILGIYVLEFDPHQNILVHLDLKGNFIQKKIEKFPEPKEDKVRLIGASGNHNSKSYELIENMEEEIWELHIKDLSNKPGQKAGNVSEGRQLSGE